MHTWPSKIGTEVLQADLCPPLTNILRTTVRVMGTLDSAYSMQTALEQWGDAIRWHMVEKWCGVLLGEHLKIETRLIQRREICECDGRVCVLEVIGAPPSQGEGNTRDKRLLFIMNR
jgi:hypothetical protein